MPNDNALCPLCQKSNNCARAMDDAASACWCQNVSFTDELIAKAKTKTKTKASSTSCICKTCAEQAQQLSTELR